MMSAVNPDQLELLVNFMNKHEDLSKGLLTSSAGRAKARHLWQILLAKLNSRGPPVKSLEKWKKVWSDHKYHVKRKLKYANSKKAKSRAFALAQLQTRTAEMTGICDSVSPIPEGKSFGVPSVAFEEYPSMNFCSNKTFENCSELFFKQEPEEQENFEDSAEYITLDNYARDHGNYNEDFQPELMPRMYVVNHNEASVDATQNLSFICDVKNNSKENSLYENIRNHSTTNIEHNRPNTSFNDPPKGKLFADSNPSAGPSSNLHCNTKCNEVDYKFSNHMEEDIKVRKDFYKTVVRLLGEQNTLKKEEINIKKVKMEQREQYKEKKMSQDFEYKKQELELKKLEIETRKLAYEIELKKLKTNSS